LFEVLSPIINADNVLSIAIVMIVCGLSIAPPAPYGLNATMTSQYLGINPYRITKINIGLAFRMELITIAIAMLPMLLGPVSTARIWWPLPNPGLLRFHI